MKHVRDLAIRVSRRITVVVFMVMKKEKDGNGISILT